MWGAAFPRARGRQQGTGFWFVLLQPIFRIVGDPREAFLPLGISFRIRCGLFLAIQPFPLVRVFYWCGHLMCEYRESIFVPQILVH